MPEPFGGPENMMAEQSTSTTQDVTIREGIPSDASHWLRLRQLLWPHADPVDLRQHVEAFFGPGDPTVAAVFLAIGTDGRPLGFAEISLRAYVPGASTSPAPFLEGWFVEEPFRHCGLGRRLIGAAMHWAAARGYRELGSDSLLDNVDAALAHEAIGFREVERVRFFIKPVGGD
jgi:aminoglycoside 6'-N-acetyltransferase I